MIAQTTLHVNQENVSILVQLLMFVLRMLIAELQGIRQFALVLMDTLALLKYLAHYVSDISFYSITIVIVIFISTF